MSAVGKLAIGSVFAWLVSRAVASVAPRAPKPVDPTDPPEPTEPIDVPPGDPVSVDVDAFGVHYANANPRAVWPLPQDRATRSERYAGGTYVWARRRVTEDFGDGRPFGSPTPSRHHAGEDLRGARGADIVATEPGLVVAIDADWYDASNGEATGVVLVHHDSGITIAYGEIDPGSVVVHAGQRVSTGQRLGTIGATHMLHLEIYRGQVTRTYQWPAAGPAPVALLDPTRYLVSAATSG